MSLKPYTGTVNILWFSIITPLTFVNICQWRNQLDLLFRTKLWLSHEVYQGQLLNWALKQSEEQVANLHICSKFPSCSKDYAFLHYPYPWGCPCIDIILRAQSYDTTHSTPLMLPFFQSRGLSSPQTSSPPLYTLVQHISARWSCWGSKTSSYLLHALFFLNSAASQVNI